MICNICGHDDFVFVRRYNAPDKYERWIGKDFICRTWWRCRQCGFYKCRHNYDVKDLQQIYINGYRAEGFRGQSIREAFNSIFYLPPDESENKYRVKWFMNQIGLSQRKRSILDVGAGLGVFLYELLNYPQSNWEPYAVEPNCDAATFIKYALQIPCQSAFCDPTLKFPILFDNKFDVVSCIHTLEHMPDPEWFLKDVQMEYLKKGGKLFIEVPDAAEFSYLEDDHDEFNSCHLIFFTVQTLMQLVESSGFRVTDIHKTVTKARGLSRIMLLAES